MREAIGGTWILYMSITLILIYVFFIGFVMNYASAYRAANYVIAEIENCQGQVDNCGDPNKMKTLTKTVMSKYGYQTPNVEPNPRGIITVECVQNGGGAVYRILLPVQFDLPIVGGLTWTYVKAETKTIPLKTCKNTAGL